MPALRGPIRLLRLQSDERLVALVRRGNHSAFEALVGRYRSRLLAFCRHMLSSSEDAEDILQEVFAAAFNAMLADERELNVRPWLYRIARNRCLNHLRRATAVGVDSMDIHFADGGLSTSDKVLRRESFRDLMADVQTLPESQRTALLLREMDDLSYQEIGEAMDTTIPSVKSLLVRARVALAEAAEARRLSCEDVRLELGHVAEGLMRMSPPVRRHARECDRCSSFRSALKANNRALAAIMPAGPLLLVVKKLVLTKVGSTASASGAGAAGAGTGGAAGGAAVGTAGSGMAGVVSAGAGAVATKAAAGLAAAAIVTAGAVEVRHVATPAQPRAVASAARPSRLPTDRSALAVPPASHAFDRLIPRDSATVPHPHKQVRSAKPAKPGKPSVAAPATLTAKLPAPATTPVKGPPGTPPKPPSAMLGSGTTALPSPSHSEPSGSEGSPSTTEGSPSPSGAENSSGPPAGPGSGANGANQSGPASHDGAPPPGAGSAAGNGSQPGNPSSAGAPAGGQQQQPSGPPPSGP